MHISLEAVAGLYWNNFLFASSHFSCSLSMYQQLVVSILQTNTVLTGSHNILLQWFFWKYEWPFTIRPYLTFIIASYIAMSMQLELFSTENVFNFKRQECISECPCAVGSRADKQMSKSLLIAYLLWMFVC